jgi:hypothetical protein
MNRSRAGDHQVENSGWLDHRAKGLIVDNIGPLDEPSKDPTSYVSFLYAIRVELVFEDPFAGGDVGANGLRNEIPRVVGDEGINFYFHCTALICIDERASD